MSNATILADMRTAISFAEQLENVELLHCLLNAHAGVLSAILENIELQFSVTALTDRVLDLKAGLA